MSAGEGHADPSNITSQHPASIYFKDHRGNVYIWPFHLCRSLEAIKPLIEEAYDSLHGDQHIIDVKNGDYNIQSDSGAIILPSLWDFFVTPSSRIEIAFWGNDVPAMEQPNSHNETVPRMRSPVGEPVRIRLGSPRKSDDDLFEAMNETRIRHSRAFSHDATQQETLDAANGEIESIEDDSTSSLSSSDHEDEAPDDIKKIQVIREVPPLIDIDGNKLSFAVETSEVAKQDVVHAQADGHERDASQPHEQKSTLGTTIERYSITKAVMAGTDVRATIQIHTLPGPVKTKLSDSARLSWTHLYSEQLSLVRFQEACLNLPNLSDRLRLLVKEIMIYIERHRVKAFLDGFFVEPGTVVRAVEKCQTDPQSVIFSSIPYFELQQPRKRLPPSPGKRLFPPRTLMQFAYPYEQVQDRDSEQSYKKIGGTQKNCLVYVPNIWMLNVGTEVVVTYGHRPLADAMVKSIEIVPEDLRQLNPTHALQNAITSVNLCDEEGLEHVYSLESCRSYFQLEAKKRAALNLRDEPGPIDDSRLTWRSPEGSIRITAQNWITAIKRTDLVFIKVDIERVKPTKAKVPDPDLDEILETAGSEMPFFLWPSTEGSSPTKNPDSQKTSNNYDYEDEYLDNVQNDMLNEVLDRFSTINAVDNSFASTRYYKSLPENTREQVSEKFHKLCSNVGCTSHTGYHAALISRQIASITTKSSLFWKLVQATLSLFVSDTSKKSMLRKVWSALGNIHDWAAGVRSRGAIIDLPPQQGTETYMDSTGWYIRGGKEGLAPLPSADKQLKKSIKHCRRCTSGVPFVTSEAAIDHLQSHKKPAEQKPATNQTAIDPNLSDWIVYSKQLEREEANAGGLKILSQACTDALELLKNLKELGDGVRNEDGKMSGLYTFPRGLLEAFRKLIVFYLAVERALYHTEESYQNFGKASRDSTLPYSDDGMEVLKRFAQGVANSVQLAREDLCSMVSVDTSTDPLQDVSLGPEYICSWLMRRLLVKPLENRLAIGDMYREYLSNIQFQVNHRPGKRLIRRLNLLQEELQVLAMINSSQTKVVQNYMRVLDDRTYEVYMAYRHSMFLFERTLLQSTLENLAIAREEYNELIRRCGPLSDQTKQSLEIYEEDHGKAINAFTVVTVIFLPLSFVTSYLGMNTADIRDMTSSQSLFWAIALPLTVFTIGATVLIGYNGDVLRDFIASVCHRIIGRPDSTMSARGMSVAQRKRAKQLENNLNDGLEMSVADEAEYAKPQPESVLDEWYNNRHVPVLYNEVIEPTVTRTTKIDPYIPTNRSRLRSNRFQTTYVPPPPPPPPPAYDYDDSVAPYGRRHVTRQTDWRNEEGHSTRIRPEPEAVTVYQAANRRDDNYGLRDEYTWHKKRGHRHGVPGRHVRRDY
ncbi:hypothetical protein ACEQ8H_002128 [Pleosporales sp. CAS-2024a]